MDGVRESLESRVPKFVIDSRRPQVETYTSGLEGDWKSIGC